MSKTKDSTKHASLTDEEREELVYYMREATSRNIEANMWNAKAGIVEKKVLSRLDLDPNKYEINWSESIHKGKISYDKKKVS